MASGETFTEISGVSSDESAVDIADTCAAAVPGIAMVKTVSKNPTAATPLFRVIPM
jgi:hypothetical protein